MNAYLKFKIPLLIIAAFLILFIFLQTDESETPPSGEEIESAQQSGKTNEAAVEVASSGKPQSFEPEAIEASSSADRVQVRGEESAPAGDRSDMAHGRPDILLRLVREARPEALAQWQVEKSASSSRKSVAVYQTNFRYPHIRVEEPLDKTTSLSPGREVPVEPTVALVADHLLVAPSKDVSRASMEASLRSRGYVLRPAPPAVPFSIVEVRGFEEEGGLGAAVEELEKLPEIAYAEPDYLFESALVPNDPSISLANQWALDEAGDYDIEAPQGWLKRRSAADVVVAVVDSGIELLHEDLIDNLWVNPNEQADGQDSDGNGWVDDLHGVNFLANDHPPADDNGHGTHVAGIIGAVGNNGTGISGVAWDVQLMALKVLNDEGVGTLSDSAAALYYARDHGASIVNVSWGSREFSRVLSDAVHALGRSDVIVVAAAGNDGGDSYAYPRYPASYRNGNIVSVAATDRDGELTRFSNYGTGRVDVAAPGQDILSTFFGGPEEYRLLNGTSMAAPHVAGILALLKAEYPNDGSNLLLSRLYQSVQPTESLVDRVRFEGIVSLGGALSIEPQGVIGDAFERPRRLKSPRAYWSGSTTGAGQELDGPFPNDNRSLWFEYRSSKTGWVEITFEADLPSGKVAVYEKNGERNPVVSLEEQGVSQFYAEEGQSFTLVVDDTGEESINFALWLVERPSNDHRRNAEPTPDAPFTLNSYNNGATAEFNEDLDTTHGAGRSIWYQWQATRTAPAMMTTKGSRCDTVLTVYRKSSGAPEFIGTNDDHDFSFASRVNFDAVAGQTYLISVDAYQGKYPGDITLSGYYSDEIVVVLQPEDLTVQFGDPLSLSVTASSGPPLSYQWYKDGQPIYRATSNGLLIHKARPADMGQYHVEISNAWTTLDSRTVEVSEKVSAPRKIWQSGDKTIAQGLTTELRIVTEGSLPLEYQWYFDGQVLPGETSSILSLPNVAQDKSGSYRVEVSNTYGAFSSEPMQLKVVDNPLTAWNWRVPSPWGGDVVDLDYADGHYYAIIQRHRDGLLLRSPDAESWQEVPLPENVIPTAIWMEDGKYRLVGKPSGGAESPILYSTDGLNWEKRLFDFGDHKIPTRIEHQNGVDYIYTPYGSYSGYLWISTDGFDWNLAPFPQIRDLSVGNGKIVVLDVDRYTTRSSSDGIDWSDGSLSVSASTLGFYDNRFYANRNASSDGITWEQITSNSPPRDLVLYDGSQYIALSANYYWTAETYGNWSAAKTHRGVKQNVNLPLNDALIAGGRILLAGDNGLLVSASGYDSVVFEHEYRLLPVGAGTSGKWVNDSFMVVDGQVLQHGYRSGDGVTWHEIPGWNGIEDNPFFAAGGFFYTSLGSRWNSSIERQVLVGSTPMHLEPVDSIPPGFFYKMTYKYGRYWAIFYTQDDFWEGPGEPLDGFITSSDGLNWTQVTDFPTDGLLDQTFFDNGDYLIFSSRSKTFITMDGANWIERSVSLDSNQLVAAGDGVIAYEYYDSYSGIRYSNDMGETWAMSSQFPFSSPDHLIFHNGQFVVISDYWNQAAFYNMEEDSWTIIDLPTGRSKYRSFHGTLLLGNSPVGGDGAYVLQSGLPPSAAPLAELVVPALSATVTRNSTVPLVFEVSDPEGQLAEVECWYRNEIVYSGTESGRFTVHVEADEIGTFGVKVVARDEDGLSTADYGLLEVVEGDYDVKVADVAISGDLKAVGDYVYTTMFFGHIVGTAAVRSRDGLDWEKVPHDAGSAIQVNGLLVNRTSSAIVTSEDGENWTEHTILPTHYSFKTPLVNRDGYLAAYASSGSTGLLAVSLNGLDWNVVEAPSRSFTDIILGDDGAGLLYRVSHTDKQVYPFQIGSDGVVTFYPSVTREAYPYFANGRFIVVMNDGTYRHSVDGKTWTVDDWNWSGHEYRTVVNVGQRYFMLYGLEVVGCSEDGVNWTPVAAGIAGRLYFFEQRYIVVTDDDKLLASNDGINWSEYSTLPFDTARFVVPFLSQFPAGDYLATDTEGSYATSEDLIDWEPFYPVSPVPEFTNGSVWLGWSDYVLYRSDDEGASWIRIPELESVYGVQGVTLSASEGGFFVNSNYYNTWFSPDGKNWHKLSNMNIGSFIYDKLNRQFLAIRTNGSIRDLGRSEDGVNWTFTEQALLNNGASGLFEFNGSLFMTDHDNSEGATFWESEDGGYSWVELVPGNNQPWSAASGWVVDDVYYTVFNDDVIYSTTDLVNWKQAEALNMTKPTKGRYTVGGGNIYALEGTNYRYLKVSEDGISWELMANVPDANEIRYFHGEIYLITDYGYAIYTDQDLSFIRLEAAPADYGVGDPIEVTVGISNRSVSGEVDSSLKMEYRLSLDRIWDSGDIRLGVSAVPTTLAAGQDNQWQETFQIPSNVQAGEYYIIGKLDSEESLHEKSEINNLRSTVYRSVRIRDWTLDINIQGNGISSLSDTSVRYSHQEQIDLIALGDKENLFAGWLGDDLSGYVSMLTLLMDRDRELTANFTTVHNLVVDIVGGGAVVNLNENSFEPGTVVDLKAVPEPGWSFHHWEGDLNAGTAEVSITMDSSKTVRAVFSQTYSDWAAFELSTVDEARHQQAADPDHDGCTNYMEYLAGTDPLDPEDKVFETGQVGTIFYLRYWQKRGVLDAGLVGQKSVGRLDAWEAATAESNVIDQSSEARLIQIELPLDGADAQFIRLKAVAP